MVRGQLHILQIYDPHWHGSKYTKCLYDLIMSYTLSYKIIIKLLSHYSCTKALTIDLNVNIKDAVIWDVTPYNSVTCYDQLDNIASKSQKV